MILFNLFMGFLRVGCFAFGGAYGAIPLIRDVVLSFGWLTDEELSYMIAVSESTPGPIMVNMATYVGSSQAGFLGALIATFAVVLPSFLIILLVVKIFTGVIKNPNIQAVLRGLKPCIIGVVLSMGIYMTGKTVYGGFVKSDIKTLLLTAAVAVLMFAPQMLKKKKISPIILIVIGAVAGIFIY